MAQITLSKILSSSDLLIKSQGRYCKSFGYITGLNNDSFNEIEAFKIRVAQSKRNGKDNAKFNYCRWVACRRLKEGSIINNLQLEQYMFTLKTKMGAKV